MNTYAYVALEPSGRRQAGVIEAANKEAAIMTLSADGRFVLEVKEQGSGAGKSVSVAAKARGSVSRADLALFTRRLADLSEAGLPLDRVLQVISEQSESAVLSDVASKTLDEVRAGRPVSESLAMHSKYFPQVFTETLRAGEASGQFPEVASRLADFQEREVSRRNQITSAMIYPAILATTAIGVVIFLLSFVVPKLAAVFKTLGGELPINTRILLAVSAFMSTNGLTILVVIVVAIIAYRAYVATDTGKLARDTLLLKIPMIGPVARKSTVSRFARVLGTLVYGGVPILESLRIAGRSSGNAKFQLSAELVEREVREGRPIAQAMRDGGAFPPVLTHMVAIGEETGDLPKMLNRVADSMDFEVDNGLRRLTALFEPIIVLVMGGFVGFVVISVLLPIYQAQDLVK